WRLPFVVRQREFRRDLSRIEKVQPNDSLHNSQARDNNRYRKVEDEEAAQVALVAEQSISYKQQRHVKIIHTQAQQAVNGTGRLRVEHLQHAPCDKQEKRSQEACFQAWDPSADQGGKESEV